MAVSSSGGPQDRPRPIDPRLASEPTVAETKPSDPVAGFDQEVSDHETAALEQAFDLFQQRMSARQSPFDPLGWSLPEGGGAAEVPLSGLAPHPEVVEPPRREV